MHTIAIIGIIKVIIYPWACDSLSFHNFTSYFINYKGIIAEPEQLEKAGYEKVVTSMSVWNVFLQKTKTRPEFYCKHLSPLHRNEENLHINILIKFHIKPILCCLDFFDSRILVYFVFKIWVFHLRPFDLTSIYSFPVFS